LWGRVRVGGPQHNFDQPGQHAVDVVEHFVVPESHDVVSTRCKPRIAYAVFVQSFIVLTTVYFNDQHRLEACKIDDARSDRHLASEATILDLAVTYSMRSARSGIGHVLS
jgi:hypothetical protein